MKLLKRLDMAAGAIILAGAAAACINGLTEDRPNDRQSGAITGGYAVLGGATLYAVIRILGPKSRRDQRLSQIATWYDQADSYQRRMQLYRKAAEQLLKRISSRGKDS